MPWIDQVKSFLNNFIKENVHMQTTNVKPCYPFILSHWNDEQNGQMKNKK